jgi:hypothetical protein
MTRGSAAWRAETVFEAGMSVSVNRAQARMELLDDITRPDLSNSEQGRCPDELGTTAHILTAIRAE